MLDRLKESGFDVRALHHAEAILEHDMPAAVAELEEVLLGVRIPAEELVRGGGGEADLTQRIRRALSDDRGWEKHEFEVKTVVDGVARESTTHEIDHLRRLSSGAVALEIEWNNKDPFFDRDLDNFKRLHADGAISVGAIVTRGASLQSGLREVIEAFAEQRGIRGLDDLLEFYEPTRRQRELIGQAAEREGSFRRGWAKAFVADKFGEATTHWRKLEQRVDRGVGNPCPLLLVGLPREIIVV